MALQLHPTEPLDGAGAVAPARARAIAAAPGRHLLPLLASSDGRAETLASGAPLPLTTGRGGSRCRPTGICSTPG